MPPDSTLDPWLRSFLLICRDSAYVFLKGTERLLGIRPARKGSGPGEQPTSPLDPNLRRFFVLCRESGYVFLRGLERMLGMRPPRRE